MDWTQVLALMGAVFIANMGVIIPMFLWVRSEANADRRQMQQEAASDRKDILQLIRNIQDEMRDFHMRLERIDSDFKNHLIYHHGIEERNKPCK